MPELYWRKDFEAKYPEVRFGAVLVRRAYREFREKKSDFCPVVEDQGWTISTQNVSCGDLKQLSEDALAAQAYCEEHP